MPFDGAASPAYEPLGKIDQIIDLLESPAKWCKGAERNRSGQYCLRGAAIAVGGLDQLEPVLLGAVHQVAGRQFRRIEEFNDHPKTTHAQVLRVLHRARDNLAEGNVKYPAEAAVAAIRRRAIGPGWVSGFWQRCLG